MHRRPRIRIAILAADDAYREALAALIATANDVTVVLQAAAGAQALSGALASRPDVFVVSLPNADDAVALTATLCKQTDAGVVVLVAYPEQHDEALAAGACRYLLRETPRAPLLAAIHECAGLASPAIRRRR